MVVGLSVCDPNLVNRSQADWSKRRYDGYEMDHKDHKARRGMTTVRRSWLFTALLGALFIFSAVNAIIVSREALHYREIGSASTQLELAAHTLSMIELIDAPPVGVELEREVAIDLLEDEASFDQTGLDPVDRQRAVDLTNSLTGNALIDGQTERAEVEELLRILHNDASNSAMFGTEAEMEAFRFIVLSAVSGIGIVLMVFGAQRSARKLKRSLRKQANTDFLTGLPNRRELPVAFGKAREEMHASGATTAMLYMDLDGFKEINDSGGHATGDEILRIVAEKLRLVVGPNETLVRLGGDEFGVVVRNLSSNEEALQVAERYRTCLDQETTHGNILAISIGLAVTQDVESLEDLQSQANLAMYEAKKRQGSSVALFEGGLREAANATTRLQRALRSANLDEEFTLEYQPIVSIEGGDVFFVEALLRWNSPSLGRVGPQDFIPLAETTGEIIRIGEWLLHSAFRQLTAWQENPLTSDLSISVNISIFELEDEGFIDRLTSAAALAGHTDPTKLIIEVTESSATGPLVMERLTAIQKLGYRVAIDDFGSGYSNLAQLIHTPFDILKIDRQLISSLEKLKANGEQSLEVLSAVSAIARVQGAPVVCEGVEEASQLEPLLRAEISHIQGWLISKSMAPDALVQMLAERDSMPSAA